MDEAYEDEDELADQLEPRRIAMLLLDSVRGSESLEASLDAACELLHRMWEYDEEELRHFVPRTDNKESSLRSVSAAGAKTLADAIRRYVPRGQYGHTLVFEALLQLRTERLARAGLSFSSNRIIEQLMAGLVGRGRRLLDPACGLGGTLIAADLLSPRDVIWGVEINDDIASLAAMRVALNGTHASVATFDFLEGVPPGTRTLVSGEYPEKWDAIVAEPPMGSKVRMLDSNIRPRTVDGDAIWLTTIADALAPNGRAVILLPASFSSRAGYGKEIRASLLEQGRVEAVIALPSGSVLNTSIPTHLWVVTGADTPPQDEVLMVNSATAFTGDEGDSGLTRTLKVCTQWLEAHEFPAENAWFARPVSTAALLRGADTSPNKYLEAPPKQEQPRPEPPAHLFTELRLEGFKSVGRPTAVPLRPLTLVYGKNSSGKSSILQSLLLLRQSADHATVQPNGQFVQLGSFAGLVHGQDEQREIRIGITFGSNRVLDSGPTLPDPRRLRSVDLRLGTDIDGRGIRVIQARTGLGDDSFAWDSDEGDPTHFSISRDEAVALVDLAYSADAVYPPRQKPSTAQGGRVRSVLRTAEIDHVKVTRAGLLPAAVSAETLDELTFRTAGHTRSGLAEAALRTATSLPHAVSEEARNLLTRLSYLGPLRQPPERISSRSSATTGIDVPFFLLDNTSEREQVSSYLQRLGVNYELDAILVSDHYDRRILGDAAAIVLTDKRSGIRLTPADVGFGISQVLPIVVELSARTNAVIVVEQPEIHLHPAMQADLADLAIESVQSSGRANQVIMETHSENFMLRVQRRIREGLLDSKDVAVIYVDQDSNGGAIVNELRIDESGEFLDDWPNGFFVERFDEVFGDLA